MSDYGGLGVTVGTNMIEYLDPVEGTVWEGLGARPYWKKYAMWVASEASQCALCHS